MLLMRYATALAVLGLAYGCSSSQEVLDPSRTADLREPYLFLVRTDTAAVDMDALIRGRVTRDAQGCLRVDTDDRHTIVWPRGYTARLDGDAVVISDAAGARVAATGDVIQLGGGEVSMLPAGLLAEPTRAAALTSCAGKFWIAAN